MTREMARDLALVANRKMNAVWSENKLYISKPGLVIMWNTVLRTRTVDVKVRDGWHRTEKHYPLS